MRQRGIRGLDAFCGAGGCTKGYQRSMGAYMVGCDIKPQPNYCGDEFIQGDALELVADQDFMAQFDFAHASPPCQLWTTAVNATGTAQEHPDLITPLRPLLEATGLPYVIENVPRAPLIAPVMLCGSMFDVHRGVFCLRRHRIFETNWGLQPHQWPCRHKLQHPRFLLRNSSRDGGRLQSVLSVFGHSGQGEGTEAWRMAMEIDWMNRDELAQAIPPAYTELIGHQLMQHLEAKAAA